MSTAELQCPFCEATSSRGQGLASHIRNRHPKQYKKWLKTRTRLEDVQKNGDIPNAATTAPEPLVDATVEHQDVPVTVQASEGTGALELLKNAQRKLTERKGSIEAELARFVDLTKELETVTAQIEALDKTLVVFEQPS